MRKPRFGEFLVDGEAVKKRCEESPLYLHKIAEKAGVDARYLRKVCSEGMRPRKQGMIELIAVALEVPLDELLVQPTPGANEARPAPTTVDDASTLLLDCLPQAGPIVDLDQKLEKVLGELARGQDVLISGISGSGKTHLALHSARRLSREGVLPVFADASHLDRKPQEWLDDAVSIVSDSFDTLVADHQYTLLLVDNVSSCPPPLRQRLYSYLLKLRRHQSGLRLIVTAQSEKDFGDRFAMVSLPSKISEDTKRAILGAYGLTKPIPVRALAPLSTPYDVAIAAEVWSKTSEYGNRYELIHAFVHTRLAKHNIGHAQSVLGRLAATMSDNVATSVSPSGYTRICEELFPQAGLAEELLRTGLVRESFGQVSFAHDMLRYHALTGAILSIADDITELVRLLKEPMYEHLARLALEAQQNHSACKQLLQEAPMLRGHIPECALGERGPLAQRAALDLISETIAALQSDIRGKRVQIGSSQKHPLRIEPKLSTLEEAVLRCLCQLAGWDPIYRLATGLAKTLDSFLIDHRAELANQLGIPGQKAEDVIYSSLSWSILGAQYSRRTRPQPESEVNQWKKALRSASSLRPFELSLLVHICIIQRPQLLSTSETAANQVLCLIRAASQVPYDQMRSAALRLGREFRGILTKHHAGTLVDWIENLPREEDRLAFANDILLRQASLERPLSRLREEIVELVAASSGETNSKAAAIHLELSESSRGHTGYTQFISTLESQTRNTFLAMALMGARESWEAYLAMESMYEHCFADSGHAIERALHEVVRKVPPDYDDEDLFALACCCLGRLGHSLPHSFTLPKPDIAGWCCLGGLLYAASLPPGHRCGLTRFYLEYLLENSENLIDLFVRASQIGPFANDEIASTLEKRFPDEISRFYTVSVGQLASTDSEQESKMKHLASFYFDRIAVVGDDRGLVLLRGLVEHEILGPLAVRTLRRRGRL